MLLLPFSPATGVRALPLNFLLYRPSSSGYNVRSTVCLAKLLNLIGVYPLKRFKSFIQNAHDLLVIEDTHPAQIVHQNNEQRSRGDGIASFKILIVH